MEIASKLHSFGIIPVIEIDPAESAIPLGSALIDGGLPVAEVTFRTSAAEYAIKLMAKHHPQILLGAGSVLSTQQAETAVKAGAKYIVSPGFDPRVVDWCIEHEIPVFPGVATPTEISMGLAKGLSILKFFPAEALGGIKMLKAISAPFKVVKFIPTGGISTANLADYLALPAVHACGGSWIVSKQLISENKYEEITRLTAEAVEIVKKVRG